MCMFPCYLYGYFFTLVHSGLCESFWFKLLDWLICHIGDLKLMNLDLNVTESTSEPSLIYEEWKYTLSKIKKTNENKDSSIRVHFYNILEWKFIMKFKYRKKYTNPWPILIVDFREWWNISWALQTLTMNCLVHWILGIIGKIEKCQSKEHS